MRDNPGPRAVLNALERLADGYEGDIRHLKAEIGIKEGQLRDYEGRIGKPFAHEEYASQLADLRDQLKLGLSEKPPEGSTPTAEIAERIQSLRTSVTVVAASERTGTRKAVRAERSVTERIRERIGEVLPVVEEQSKPPVTPPTVIPMPGPVKPITDYRQALVKRRQGDGRQLSLF